MLWIGGKCVLGVKSVSIFCNAKRGLLVWPRVRQRCSLWKLETPTDSEREGKVDVYLRPRRRRDPLLRILSLVELLLISYLSQGFT